MRLTVSVCEQEKVTKRHVFRGVKKIFVDVIKSKQRERRKASAFLCREFRLVVDKFAIKKVPLIGLPISLIKMERETRLTVSVCEQEKVTKCHVFRRVKKIFVDFIKSKQRERRKASAFLCREFRLVVDKFAIKKVPLIGLPISLIKMERETRLTVSVCEQEKVTKCHVFRGVKKIFFEFNKSKQRERQKALAFLCREFRLVVDKFAIKKAPLIGLPIS